MRCGKNNARELADTSGEHNFERKQMCRQGFLDCVDCRKQQRCCQRSDEKNKRKVTS